MAGQLQKSPATPALLRLPRVHLGLPFIDGSPQPIVADVVYELQEEDADSRLIEEGDQNPLPEAKPYRRHQRGLDHQSQEDRVVEEEGGKDM